MAVATKRQQEKPLTTPGPSGPPRRSDVVRHESRGVRREAEKAISIEQAHEHEQELKEAEKRRVAELEARREARRVAFEVGGA